MMVRHGVLLNNSNLQSTFRQIFSHFKSDKACTDNDSFFWMIVQGCHNFIEIGNIAERVVFLASAKLSMEGTKGLAPGERINLL